jgi:hypothetical protein
MPSLAGLPAIVHGSDWASTLSMLDGVSLVLPHE